MTDALKEEVNKKKVVGRFNTLLLIDNAPTVEPKKTQGEWVWVQYDADTNIGDFYCSACRYIPKDLKGRYKSYIQYSSMNYCPNCGADMRKENKE